VLTGGAPGWTSPGTSAIGETGLPGGLTQVTWNGQPLYLFSNEQAMPLPNGPAVPVGNGPTTVPFSPRSQPGMVRA
jgi:hypothetical protein